MAPHVEAQTELLSPPVVPPESRLSLDPTFKRLWAIDGGWWPRSRNATVELPRLVSLLNAQLGVIVRLGVDARDWDDIPRRVTVGGRVVRIGRFADVNHKIIATRGPQDHIQLLVVPPHASTAAAKSVLSRAATGRDSGRPEEILAASGIENESKSKPPEPIREEDDHPREPGIHSTDAAVTEDARQGDIGRRLDDGAPSTGLPIRQPS